MRAQKEVREDGEAEEEEEEKKDSEVIDWGAGRGGGGREGGFPLAAEDNHTSLFYRKSASLHRSLET